MDWTFGRLKMFGSLRLRLLDGLAFLQSLWELEELHLVGTGQILGGMGVVWMLKTQIFKESCILTTRRIRA
jgi:hypothetical protein